ncbi:hypothetical protein GW796_06310 [archaeon]|nr:hypothetical protein [archaeon]
MKKINLLIGLPGSGKSTWLSGKDKNCVFDDISQTDPLLHRLKTISIEDCDEIWISDVNFCDKKILIKALDVMMSIFGKEIIFNFIIFDVNEYFCRLGVENRNDGRNVMASIDRFSKTIGESVLYIKENFNFNTESYCLTSVLKRKP